MHPAVVRRAVYPLYDLVSGRHIVSCLRSLERSQWLPAEALRALQVERLRYVLTHASTNVPFYQRHLSHAGVQPAEATLTELSRIPPIDKATLVAQYDDFVARNLDRKDLRKTRTRGSTGPSLNVFWDTAARDWSLAALLRCYTWCGVPLGEKYAAMWNFWEPTVSRLDVRRNELRHRAKNGIKLYGALLSDESVEIHLRRMRAHRPRLLFGYPSSIEALGKLARHTGMQPFGLTAVASTGEVLFPSQRENIEAGLHAPVFNGYGCAEFDMIAHECEQRKGFHVIAENVIIEVLQGNEPAPPGERGEITVTSLVNVAMPLIRYRTGDIGRVLSDSCSCGRALPRLEVVEGRVHDMIVSPTGDMLPSHFFQDLFVRIPGVVEFQLIQESPQRLVISIVKTDALLREDLERCRQLLLGHLGTDMTIAYRFVPSIPRSAGGKFRYTISKVAGQREQTLDSSDTAL